MPELKDTKGFTYFQETKFTKDIFTSFSRPNIDPGPKYKTYPDAPKVELPRKLEFHEGNLWQALSDRRSIRRYDGDHTLPLEHLSLLFWAMQGVTATMSGHYFRTAPSAGALYPVETYVAVERVKGVKPGLYHFDVKGFALEELRPGSVAQELSSAALGQSFLAKGAVTFIWTAVFRRCMAKYGHRGLRYIFMDVGHICQNLLLAATALDLGACPVAAFLDDEMNNLLQVDGEEEAVLYLAGTGKAG